MIRFPHLAISSFLLALAATALAPARAENIVFPTGSVVDITKPPYNAVGDGKADDTVAFQQALVDKVYMIYVPNGTYLVSDTLAWGKRQTRQVIQGQSEAGTIIRLKDASPGFQDPNNSRAVIWTGEAPAQRFRNGVRNVTVDIGKDNPGATGIQYIANNQGRIDSVTIRSGDAHGVIGLDLGYTNEQGPCYIQRVTVRGFATGIRAKHAVDGIVLEDITLVGQHKVGFDNDGQCVSLHRFKSDNAVPAYVNRKGASLTAMIDAELTGRAGASALPAIDNGAGLFARDVRTTGYGVAIRNTSGTDRNATGPNVNEFVSHPVLSLFPSPPRSMNLPIKMVPEVPWPASPDEWASVKDYQPNKKTLKRADGKERVVDDWTDAVQQAIDSGKPNVIFPPGHYYIAGEVFVRGNVQRIHGGEATIEAAFGGLHGTITVEDGVAPVVLIENVDGFYSELHWRHAGKRTFVLRSIGGNEAMHITKEKGSGDLYVDDATFGNLTIHGGNVWSRQLNNEGEKDFKTKVLNDGGTLWVLGWKTEGDTVLLHNKNGARTEILGGFIYANKNHDPDKIMVLNEDSDVSFTLGEWVIRKQPFNPVRETRGGQTRTLKKGDAYARGEGSMIPLYVGYRAEATSAAQSRAAPPNGVSAESKGTGAIAVNWDAAGAPSTSIEGVAVRLTQGGETVATAIAPIADGGLVLNRGVRAGQAYAVEVEQFNSSGSSPAATAKVDTPPGVAAGNGTGLTLTRFDDPYLSKRAEERTVPLVSTIGDEAAKPKSPVSLRLTGEVVPRFTEQYRFTVEAAGETRLWVGDELVAHHPSGRSTSGEVDLTAGEPRPIRIELTNTINPAKLTVTWSSANQPAEALPTSQLNPQSAPRAVVSLTGLVGELSEGLQLKLTARRDGDTSRELHVALQTGGTARHGIDYTLASESFHFTAGQAQAEVTIDAPQDARAEADARLTVTLLPSATAFVSGGPMTIVMPDDDAPSPGNGTGLTAAYFDDLDFKSPKATRLEKSIGGNWDKRPPHPEVNPDKYGVRWSGKIQPHYTEEYLFAVDLSTYGGARVLVDGKPIIDVWTGPEDGLRGGRVKLDAGRLHDIVVEYENRKAYGSRLRLTWSSPSQFEQAVPASQLHPKSQ